MKFRSYQLIQRAVAEGTDYGYARAHKHTDKPSEDTLKSDIIDGIMNELSDIMHFDTEEEEIQLIK